MSLRLFNLFQAVDQSFAAPGWFLAAVSHSCERHQTVVRGRVPSPSGQATVAANDDASDTSPCRRNGHSKRTARSPKGDGFCRRAARESRPPSVVVPAEAASAQLVSDSFVGPHRSPASPGVATLELFRVDIVVIQPVTGPRANPIATGSGMCRSETKRSNLKWKSHARGRRCCPSSAYSSPSRAGGRGVS